MTIQEIEDKYKNILDAAHQYSVLYEKGKDKFPYRLNVIKELHDDENAHSRILIRLLQYKEKGEYTWLNFFVNRMNELCGGDVNIEISNPSIDTEHPTGDGRIDGLIMEEGKYAIIIENKIWDAVDQNEQIDKYVKYVKQQRGVDTKNIFVIYLTRNGSKVVSKNSLTEETKNALGNHFIPMSFQYDILPWLEEDVLPNCKIKEKCLETAVYQYIDYLKGLFGQFNYQKQAQKSALKQIFKDMDIEDNYTELKAKYEEVQELATTLGNKVNEIGKKVADKFQQLTKEVFSNKEDFAFKDNNQIKYDSGYYQVYNECWATIRDLHPYLDWIPLKYTNLFEDKELTLVLRIESYPQTRDKCVQVLFEKAKEKNVDCLKKYDITTYYKQTYLLDGKTFASMSEDEQRAFLNRVYSSKEINQIIGLMNETIEEMKKQK